MVQVVSMKRQPVQSEEMPAFIGIDCHKAYSVYSVLDTQGDSLGQGRIDYAHRRISARWCDDGRDAAWSLKRGMNWQWLFEVLEMELFPERVVLGKLFKTRIIAEAQIKTDFDFKFALARRVAFCYFPR